MPLFTKEEDYAAFERVLAQSLERIDAPSLLSWCLMPNHWHLVVQAGKRSNLSTWMQWVTVTHTHRWHAHTKTIGEGPLYQGRFKSFPVQEDSHFLTLCCYVEANARRAKFVKRAEAWRWGSPWVRANRNATLSSWLRPWPVNRPRNWLADINRPVDDEIAQQVNQSIQRGIPLGDNTWRTRVSNRLGLDITLRPRGRPRKEEINST